MRTAQPRATVKKGGHRCLIGQTKGGMNTKMYPVTNSNGRPFGSFVTASQAREWTGAADFWTACPELTGCWQTEAMTLIGIGKR